MDVRRWVEPVGRWRPFLILGLELGVLAAFAIGYDAYDAGSLADSWRFDVGTPAYGRPYNTDTTGAFPPPADSGRQTTAETMREALAAATR